MATNNISSRIRELREENKMTQLELAKALYVKQQTIAQWEKGERDLKTNSIIDIANYFQVTTDYLLGLSDYRTTENADIGKATGLSESSIGLLKYNYKYWNIIDNVSKKYCADREVKDSKIDVALISSMLLNGYCDILNDFICGLLKTPFEIILPMYRCRHKLDIVYKTSKVEDNKSEILSILSYIAQANIIHKECTEAINGLLNKCMHYNPSEIDLIMEKYADEFANSSETLDEFQANWENVIKEANENMKEVK